jgi:cytochrome c biogenesis protein CcmG, thiol:disulfide interchange protein DsbE
MRIAKPAIAVMASVAALAMTVALLGCLEPTSAADRLARQRAGRPTIARATADGATIRSEAPDFELKELSGGTMRLSDYRGKVVLLNFWATWCGPCVREIPDLIALRAELGPDRIEILGVSLDTMGESVVAEFVQAHGMTYPVAIDTSGVAARYGGIRGIPTTFVIDAEGRIAESIVGAPTKATFLAAVSNASKG